MRKKDELAIDRILECAKREFLEKGFENASMRAIAEDSSYTTGMLYSRFKNKDELFHELVKEKAEALYRYFEEGQKEFAHFSPLKQESSLHDYVGKKVAEMVEFIYQDYDIYKLIISKSKGSSYANYLEQFIALEEENTMRFIEDLNRAGIKVREVRADLCHMLVTALFKGMFEVIEHDFSKAEAIDYIQEIQNFFNAGWDALLGLQKH